MADQNNKNVDALAQEITLKSRGQGKLRQFILWMGALIIGAILGWQHIPALNELFNFIAAVFTRLFQFIAIPTVSLAVMLGAKKDTGRIFGHAVVYTLLTTICAAAVGLGLFLWIAPGNLPLDVIGAGAAQVPEKLGNVTYYDHFLSVIQPYLQANVLSVMFISASVGLAFAFMPRTENREAVLKVLFGLQELLFTLIKALLYVLPIGILAFAGQLSAQ